MPSPPPVVANDQRLTTNDQRRPLPGRLRNSRDLSPQRQPAETQAAQPKLAQKSSGTPANLAAVMLARRELRLLYVLRLGLAIRAVLHSFCCSGPIRS